MMYNSMPSSGTTSSNSVAQRPGIPGNPAGSMHDYGGGARVATAASNAYGTIDQNFNNNNPYIGNNGSVVENIKGFECSDLDQSLLVGSRANTANTAASAAMQNTGYGMQQQPNNSVSSGGNMQQYNSYGCMQTSTGPNSSGQNFDFGTVTQSQPQSGQMPMSVGPQPQSRMFNTTGSACYSKQQPISATTMGHPGNGHGINTSMDQISETSYNTDPMSSSRRLSTPAMSGNPSQSYLQRSNSYTANSSFEETSQPFSSNTSNTGTGYGGVRNPTSYQEQNFNSSMLNSTQMRNRSYSTGFVPENYTGVNSGNWAESGYQMQSKIYSGATGNSSGRTMYRSSSTSSTGQTSQQSSQHMGVSRTMHYPSQRALYNPGTNSEMQGNHYGNTSMQTPSNFHNGKTMLGMNYPDRNNVSAQSSMTYSQSMSQLQNEKNVGVQSTGCALKLRHYGPMPNTINSSAGTPRMPYPSSQSSRNMPHFPNQTSQVPYANQVSSSNMEQFHGGFQGNMSSPRYPVHNQMTTSVSRRTLNSSTTCMGQTGAAMSEMSNIGCETYYNRTKPNTFGMQQDPGSSHEMYGPNIPSSHLSQFPTYDGQSARISNFPPSQGENLSATQTRKSMIFSAELEKLARLSRNPMLDTEFPLPVDEIPSSVNRTPVVPSGNGQMTNYQSNPPQMTSNPVSQSSGRRSVPNVYNNNLTGTPSQPVVQTSIKQTPIDQSYNSPASSAPPTPVVSQSISSVQRTTPERKTASSAPATPAASQDSSRQTNSVDANVNSSGSTAASPAVNQSTSSVEGKTVDAVHQLPKIPQSLKDKQDAITKANPNHHEYLSDNTVPAGQNCIAALSAACRNMIADMDNSVPKQTRQTAQSPLGNKSASDTVSIGSMRAPGSVVSGQLTPSSDVSMTSVGMSTPQGASTPLAMHMDNFSSPPSFGNIMGSDYQTQYHDFLEQSVPMPLNAKHLAEKIRKPRKRRKSEDITDSVPNQSGVKKRKPPKKSQNPSSVESLETVQSLDNISECTTMSDGHGQTGDDCRSASQTPTSVPTTWCTTDTHVSNIESGFTFVGSSQQPQLMDTDQSTQDFLDSVFSPDTTMSNIMQDVADSVMMGHVNPSQQSPTSSHASHHSNNDNASIASYQSQCSLPTPGSQTPSLTNLDQLQTLKHSNGPVSNGPKHISGQPNNTVSSSGDLVSTSVTTSGNRIDTLSDKTNSEEAHPLEILQAQIQLQRQQFNLSDSRPLPIREPGVQKTVGTIAVRKQGTTLPEKVNVDFLMAEKDSTWYVPSEPQKEPEVPWEQTRKTTVKGQCVEIINQTDRRKQNTQHEKNRRDSLKNSLDNLKNALPDGNTLMDQTQQSVLLKTHNFIVDMLGKQQKNKACSDDIESFKARNNLLQDDIAMLKQEFEILSNMD